MRAIEHIPFELAFRKYIVCRGLYLKFRLKTVRTQSGHLGWDATLSVCFERKNLFERTVVSSAAVIRVVKETRGNGDLESK